MALKKRKLGKTGLLVTEIGFGGIPIQRISEKEAVKVVRRCYELGINYFDTARAYTTSEERIGKALWDVRDKVLIATKSHAKTKKEFEENLDISLANLRTDYVDVCQLHNVTEDGWGTISSLDGALEGLIDAQKQGKIRHIGVTSHSPTFLTKLVEKGGIFKSIMVGYNYIATEPSQKLLPICHKKGIGTIIMKPFGGGAFSNPKTALKFVLADKNTDCVIPGMLSVSEVEENIEVCGGDLTLSPEEIESIKLDRQILGEQFCAACEYCQPCPVGIPISFVIRTEMCTLRRMGWTEGISRQTREASEKVKLCQHCGICESRCPYKLPIKTLLPKKMASLEKLIETKSIP